MPAQTVYDFVCRTTQNDAGTINPSDGDSLPDLAFQLEVSPITVFSAIHLDVIKESGVALPRKTLDLVTPASSINAELTDPLLGIFVFKWLPGELQEAGNHTARMVLVAAADGRELTLPDDKKPMLIRVNKR